MEKIIRHGDRIFRSLDTIGLDAIPSDLKPSGHNIVGVGESHHRHRLKNSQALVYDLKEPVQVSHKGREFTVDQYVNVTQDEVIIHEEHKGLPLAKQQYALLPEQHFDVLEQKIKSVLD